jgi:hypothetical protein
VNIGWRDAQRYLPVSYRQATTTTREKCADVSCVNNEADIMGKEHFSNEEKTRGKQSSPACKAGTNYWS